MQYDFFYFLYTNRINSLQVDVKKCGSLSMS